MERPKKRYLLIPAKPAANGGLHLGHISGPYLRLDVFRRQLEMMGHEAYMIFGVDAHDSFVLKKAKDQGTTAEAIANEAFLRIEKDLMLCNVKVDKFVNPLTEEWRDMFEKEHLEMVEQLIALGLIHEVEEGFPLSENGAMIFGSNLTGKCPKCLERIAGYFCEDCGYHFRPEEVVDPHYKQEALNSFVPRRNLFLKLNKKEELQESWYRSKLREDFIQIGKNFIEANDNFRMTTPKVWGIDWSEEHQQTLFGHGLLYAYCRFIGELYKLHTGEAVNPFDAGSDVICVNGFGVDNCVTHIVGIQAVAQAIPACKGFDHFIINYFSLLEKEKFSTSRGHAIWVKDAGEDTAIEMDGLRFYLSQKSPVDTVENFNLRDFVAAYNSLFIDQLNPLVDRMNKGFSFANTNGHVPVSKFVGRFTAYFNAQAGSLSIEKFNPRLASEKVLDWLRMEGELESDSDLYWWLKGFCFLAYPFMPATAQKMLLFFGIKEEPTIDIFQISTEAAADFRMEKFHPISIDSFKHALPETLGNFMSRSVD